MNILFKIWFWDEKTSKIILLFFLAAVLRLYFVFLYPQIPVESDALRYDYLGYNLARGNGFITFISENAVPEVRKAPGYPFFLASIFKLFGHSYKHVRFFQVLFSLMTMGFMFLTAKKIFGIHTGYICLMLAAIYPGFLSYNGLVLTESLSAFFLVTCVYLFLIDIKRARGVIYFLNGFVIGFAVLIREEFMALFVLLLMYGFFYLKADFKKILIIVLAASFTMLPWTIRNYKVSNKFIPVSSQVGSIFWISTYKGEWLEWHGEDANYKDLSKGLTDYHANIFFVKEGLKNIKKHPFLYTKFCFKRLIRFWIGSHTDTFYGYRDSFISCMEKKDYWKVIIKASFLIFNSALILTGIFGIILSFRKLYTRKKELLVILMPVLVITAIHFFLFATVRYQIPIMPFMIIFASYAILCYGDIKNYNRLRFTGHHIIQ